MSYGRRPQFVKGNTHDERKETFWRNNFHASTSRAPQIMCYYCGKKGQMKIDCRKKKDK